MGNFKLTTVEEFEAATERLLETGKKVGADGWQYRVANQTPHCKFGEQGVCCRICSMGPCRITPKAPRGICGCDVHGIVARNYLKFTAGGSATHSDHGREICHTLYNAKPEGPYKVKDPEKLIRIAKEWNLRLTLDHCTEGHLIAGEIHEAGCPAIVGPTLSSRNKIEVQNMDFKTPGILQKAGVLVAITTSNTCPSAQALPLRRGWGWTAPWRRSPAIQPKSAGSRTGWEPSSRAKTGTWRFSTATRWRSLPKPCTRLWKVRSPID